MPSKKDKKPQGDFNKKAEQREYTPAEIETARAQLLADTQILLDSQSDIVMNIDKKTYNAQDLIAEHTKKTALSTKLAKGYLYGLDLIAEKRKTLPPEKPPGFIKKIFGPKK